MYRAPAGASGARRFDRRSGPFAGSSAACTYICAAGPTACPPQDRACQLPSGSRLIEASVSESAAGEGPLDPAALAAARRGARLLSDRDRAADRAGDLALAGEAERGDRQRDAAGADGAGRQRARAGRRVREPALLAGPPGARLDALAGGRADRIGQGARGGRDPAERRRAARLGVAPGTARSALQRQRARAIARARADRIGARAGEHRLLRTDPARCVAGDRRAAQRAQPRRARRARTDRPRQDPGEAERDRQAPAAGRRTRGARTGRDVRAASPRRT